MKKGNGCGCLFWIIVLGALIYIGSQGSDNQSSARSNATATKTRTPAPTRTVRSATTVPTMTATSRPLSVAQNESEPVATTIARLATEYPEEALKAVLGAVDGVERVDTAMVTLGPSVHAELVVSANADRTEIADQLRLALVIDEEIEEYFFILNNGRSIADYIYRDGSWQVTTVSITPEASNTPLPMLSPTKTTTRIPTRIPTQTSTRRPTQAPTRTPVQNAAEVITIADRDYWTTNSINVRECPSTSCDTVGRVNQGTRLTVNGRAEGEAVTGSNRVWYRVQYGGGTAYVYSGLMSNQAPSVPPTAVPQVQQSAPVQPEQPAQPVQPTQPPPPPPPPAPAGGRPGNCATAVAMGLSAVQAAQWSHLDRDKDGVACYGD